jgi:transcriptional regulator with XRE-family HTH domain
MPRLQKKYDDKFLVKLVSHIGKMLRYYREQSGLSQNKLAKLSGVSISTINEIENCVVNDVRFSTITTLAKHLGIDPLKLIVPGNFHLSEDDKKDFRVAIKTLDRINRRVI